jgi:phospholipase/lecithinase/hemolysin
VFGDSLSDTGNLSLSFGGAVPDPMQPYASGRFSDGPLWVETLASGLGLAGQANPYLAGGNNYAYAAARTGVDLSPPGVLAQVAGIWGLRALSTPSLVDPNGLYVVVGGGNDMRDARTTFALDTPENLVKRQLAAQTAINNLSTAIALLASSGVQNVLISTLPNLGDTPEAALLERQFPGLGLLAASIDVTNRFNDLVRSQLMLKGAFGDLNIELLDMAAVAANVRASQGDFGVTNTSLPCVGFDFSAGASCATSLFSDALHPSAFAHKLIGQAALAVYGVPLPGTLALMGLALFVMVGVQRRRQA